VQGWTTTVIFMQRRCYGEDGSLWRNGRNSDDPGQQSFPGQFAIGDCIGMLLDLDAGWMRFYHNCKAVWAGLLVGVTGPLVWAAQHIPKKHRFVPGAVAQRVQGARGGTVHL
jgi:hypothetical protein